MKKITAIIVCLVMLLLTACEANKPETQKTPSEKEVIYTVYLASSDAGTAENAIAEASTSKVLIDVRNNEYETEEDVSGKSLKYSLFGIEYELKANKATTNDFTDSKITTLKNKSKWIRYGDANCCIDLYTATNEIRFYFDYSVLKNDKGERISEKEAEDAAYNALCSVYGENVVKTYTKITVQTGSRNGWHVSFAKNIGNYGITDNITVELSQSGNICAINAKNKDSFEHLTSVLSENKVKAAEAAAKAKVPEGYEFTILNIVLDENGAPYLVFSIRPENSDSE